VPSEFILQGVDDLFEFKQLQPVSLMGGIFKHRMLFVGRNINTEYLTI